jgi:hypothetical protein
VINLSKSISRRQRIEAIRTYVNQGYSANKIQKKLQSQGLGIQRKKLLAEVRRIKGVAPKANTFRYIPTKYRQKRKPPVPRRTKWGSWGGKAVAVYLAVKTRRHPKPYNARFEFHGSGKDLNRAIRIAFSGIVPPHEQAFVECSARDFVKNPFLYGERGVWLGRPNVES